jgi:hypothetical protein
MGQGRQPGPQGGGQPQLGQGQFDWRQIVQSIVRNNPGAPPQAIAVAVNKLLPLMQAESLDQWRQIQAYLGGRRVELGEKKETAGEEVASQKVAETERHHVVTEGQGQERVDIATERETRLAAQFKQRFDQAQEKIDLARKKWEQAKGDTAKRQALADWNVAIKNEHDRISTELATRRGPLGLNITKEDADRLRAENERRRNAAYEQYKNLSRGIATPPSSSVTGSR